MAQSPEQIAQRWAQGMGGARDKIVQGVNDVTVAPGQAAAAQKGAYLANVQANADKWAKRTAAVSVDEWRTAMLSKGLDRIAGGATAAQPRFANFVNQLLPHIEQVKRQLPARGTLDQNIARSAAFIRGMANFDYRR